MSEQSGEALAQVLAYNNMADRVWLIDGPAKGLEFSQKAQAVGHATGYVYDAFWAQMGGLFMLFEHGDWDRLLLEAEDSISWGQEHGATVIGSCATLFNARVSFHRGGLRKALDLEGDFLPVLRGLDDLEGLSPCLALCTTMHAFSGNEPASRALIEEFFQKTERATQYRARFLPDVMRAATAIGDTELASRLLLDVNEMTYARDRHAVVTGRAILAELGEKPELALDLHTDAATRWRAYGFLLEEGQALLGMGRCLVALGRGDDAVPRLQGARRIFSELAAGPLVEETDRYLKQATALSS